MSLLDYIFPCLDLTCLEHYTGECNSRVYDAQAARDKDGPRGKNGSMGDRTGNKSKTRKLAAPGMSSSLSTNGILGGNIGHGPGQN